MTLKEKLLTALAGALFIAAVMLAFFYVQQVKDLARAEAYGKAKQEVIETLDKRMEQREREWRERSEAWEKEKREIKSQAQAVRVIERYVPQVTGQAATVTPQQLPAEVKDKLPDSPGYTVMTEQAAIELGKEIVECQKTKEGLTKCAADKDDLRAQFKAAEEQRDRWMKTAKGGSKARRLGKILLIGGCAAGGAAGGSAAGSKPAKGAAIGALAGVVTCALLAK